MRKLLCLLLTLLFLPVISAGAEEWALSIETPAEAIRPGKAFLLSFTVPAAGVCDLTLADTEGQYVMDVVTDLTVNAGRNQLWWNGTCQSVAAAAGVYQLVLEMDGQQTACAVVIGAYAPYMTSIVPTKDADTLTMTVDFYVSVDGLLTVGLWTGNVWTLLENRQVNAGMNSFVWDASAMKADTSALTLTLTDSTGFSSNEEHVPVSPEDFGLHFATPTPEPTATPEAVETVLTPVSAPTATAEPTEEPTATPDPTEAPTEEPTATPEPTEAPTEEPTAAPEPTEAPTEEPTATPTEEPTATPEPTEEPTATPEPTEAPTEEPTATPELTEAPTEEPTATPEPVEVELIPADPVEAEAEPAGEEAAEGLDEMIAIDHNDAEAAEAESAEVLAPAVEAAEQTVFTPSYGTPYELTEADKATYWGTPMDITDTEAIWTMLTAPITVIDSSYKGQKKVYAEPSEDSRTVAVITGTSQGVRVIETRDDGWSLIELYSSTFHDNSIQAWNMLVQGYVKTSMLKTQEVNKSHHIIVDKLTQRLYLFGNGELVATLLVSTGLSNEEQPYNETRSGEFLYISATGGFSSDNMFCPYGMKFNDGDLLHEVPYIQRSEGGTKIYSATEPYLGQRASHGCIRVQRKSDPNGYDMKWIWDNRKNIGRIVVWEDWQGRQIDYPADDTVLYYNANGGSYYHSADHCESAKASIVFTPFTYAELDTGDYADLEFCPYCVPALRKAEIDKINEAHAEGGDHDPILTAARQKYLDDVVEKNGLDALTEGEKRYYQPDAAQ